MLRRVTHLSGGVSGLNRSAFMIVNGSSQAILDDGASDDLIGSNSRSGWRFARTQTPLADQIDDLSLTLGDLLDEI